jgi:hypothetical protein
VITGQLKGDLDIDKKLDNLLGAVRNKHLKRAFRAATKEILQKAKGLVPVRSGALRKSLSTKVDASRDRSSVYGLVGARSKFTATYNGQKIRPSRYSHLVQKKTPFLTTAFNRPQASNTINDILRKGVAEELAK